MANPARVWSKRSWAVGRIEGLEDWNVGRLECWIYTKKLQHNVVLHFPIEVLKQKFLECECPSEKTRWHIIPFLIDRTSLDAVRTNRIGIIWLLADTAHLRNPRGVVEIVCRSENGVRKYVGNNQYLRQKLVE